MNKKNLILKITLSIIILLIISIGISYAYFTAFFTGGEEETTIQIKGGKMTITYSGGSLIEFYNIRPGDNAVATKTFNIIGKNNNDGLEMEYKISLVTKKNTFTDDALKYTLTNINAVDNGVPAPDITEFGDILSGVNTTILGVGSFTGPTDGNRTHTYELEIYFPFQLYDQNANQRKQIEAYVLVESYRH